MPDREEQLMPTGIGMTLRRPRSSSFIPVSILVIVLTSTAAGTTVAAETSIRAKTHSRDFVGADRSFLLTPAEGRFNGGGGSGGVIISFLSNDFSQSWYLEFRPPSGQSLLPGLYYDAAHPVFRRTGQPGVQIDGGGLDCDKLTGAFEIKQLTVSGGTLSSFWATFEQNCEQFSGETRGEVRFNVEVGPSVEAPLTSDVQRTDPLTVPVGTEGFSGAAPVLTATGLPEGSVFTDQGGGTADLSWTPGFDQTADHDVSFRAEDGAGAAATATTWIRVGGVTSLVVEGDAGEFITGGRRYALSTADADLIGRSIVFNNIPLSFARLSFRSNRTGWQLEFAGPDGQLPAPGSYENVAAVGRQAPGQAGLNVTGPGRGCSNVTGRFVVRQADYGPFGYIKSFWATFEQHCEGGVPALRGEVRLDADPPVWMKAPGRSDIPAGRPLVFGVAGFSTGGGPVVLRAEGLPPGAAFADHGDGTGQFEWTPGPGQLGPIRVAFVAEDALARTDMMATDITVYAANDDFEHAAVVGELPFSTTIDSFWATRAPDDPDCGYAGEATVWFAFTPSRNLTVDVDTLGSGTRYTTLGAFTGQRGALSLVACRSEGLISFQASAGVTYYLMAGTSLTGVPLVVSVHAAPPLARNDDFDAATLIGALPFSDSVNTLHATTGADDPSLASYPCASAAYTVWYAFTPATDLRIVADTIGSDFRPTLAAFTGARGSLQIVACDNSLDGHQPRISFTAFAGTTYYFMIGSLNEFFPGGTLVFNVRGLPPLRVTIGLDPRGTLDRINGTATISGSATCSRPIDFDLFVLLEQRVAGGSAVVHVSCANETRWSTALSPAAGTFRVGPARVSASAYAFDPDTGESFAAATAADVTLKPRPVRQPRRAPATQSVDDRR